MVDGMTPLWNWARQNAHMRSEYVKSTLAEFFGTFLLCLLVVGGTTQQGLAYGNDYRYFLLPTFGQFLGYFLAIIIFGGVSGAHVNPAVTVGFAIAGKLSWIKVPLYMVAQFFGGYLGAGFAYALYVDLLSNICNNLEPVPDCVDMERIFAPPPQDRVGIPLLDQVVGTTILMMVTLATIDKRNMKIPQFLYGFVVALTYTGINYAFGINAGGVLNPARDLSPRLMAVSIGFDSEEVFGGGNIAHYWLAPLFGPFLGAALGAFVYVFLVAAQLNEEDEESGSKLVAGQIPRQVHPDWRSTEVRMSGQSPAVPAPPPLHPNMYAGARAGQRTQYY